jgi:transcriptional regulator with AAA-type ATPase domain
MQLERPAVMEVLGIRNYSAIDEFLIAAVKDSARHILLLGEPRSGQDRLGRAIHHISHRRHNRFFTLPEKPKLDSGTRQDLQDAQSGTVFVRLYQKGKLKERFVEALSCPATMLRLIICARSRDKVEASFPAELVNKAMQITIPPLRERAGEIAELLDQWFITRNSPLRFATLRAELRESLLSDPWPDNFDGLREAADHLIQLAPYRSGRQATLDSQLTRATLRSWVQRRNMQIKFPLISDNTD